MDDYLLSSMDPFQFDIIIPYLKSVRHNGYVCCNYFIVKVYLLLVTIFL